MTFILTIFTMLSFPVFASDWFPVDTMIDAAQRAELFGEASLVVGNSQINRHEYSVGESSSKKIFDIASLTKVVATTTSVMILEERGEISLADKVSRFYPEFTGGYKNDVTVEDLLRHRAGLPPGATPLNEEDLEAFVKRITRTPLFYKPRTQTVYSDLSFILLGHIVEMVSEKSLAEFARENVFLPLKMFNSSYHVTADNRPLCVPTSALESCQVHDPTAFKLMPATVGNAGVFTTIEDLTHFCRMLLNKGEYDGVRILSEVTIKKMTTPDGPRGLGWDFTSEYSPAPRGEVFPAGVSFGHTGYTGTTIWVDPRSEAYYIFLSNRVYMGDERTKKPFTAFRKKLSTAIGRVIYGPLQF